MTIHITQENFKHEVLESEKPVILDFYADWCGPCKRMSPIIEEMSREVEGVKVGKVNVEEEWDLAELFSIMSIPTLVLMREGRVVDVMSGARSKVEILDSLYLESYAIS